MKGVAPVSLDGKYIFYVGNDDFVYWVSAEIIEKLKPKSIKQRNRN